MAWVQDMRRAFARLFLPPDFGSGTVSDAAGSRVQSTYPTEVSIQAFARFPWVYAAFKAKATDLSGVPIRAIETDAAGNRRQVPNHPIAAMLNKPGARRGGILMRRQLYLDHDLTGDCFLWRHGATLFRIHPQRMEVIADKTLGVPIGYILKPVDAPERRLKLEDVVHVSDISWEDGPVAALGTGAIMSMHRDLSANLAVKDMTAKAAKRGRLELLLAPKGDNALGSKQVEQLVRDFERNRMDGRAAFVVGRDIEATPLGLSPRDMEFGEQDLRTTAAILAVAGVPPVRVGIPGANYGTTKQQMRTYWEGLVGEAALFDEALSLLDPNPAITLEHDFTNVEALQVSYTERQNRVRGWYELGATAKAAAAYEGFLDAPVGDKLFDSKDGVFRPSEKEPDEGQERTAALRRYLEGARGRYRIRVAAPEWVPGRDVESLRLLVELERVGVADDEALAVADRVAKILDEVAYQAHLNGRSVDGSPSFEADTLARMAA